MSLFSRIVTARIIQYMASEKRLARQRSRAEKKRQAKGAPHIIEYFHQVDDPYSHLMLQALPIILRKYSLQININLVDGPPDWAAPEREKLYLHSLADASLIAEKSGLDFPESAAQPDKAQMQIAQNLFANLSDENTFFERALDISTRLWAEAQLDGPQELSSAARTALESGGRKRDKFGHYLGATLYYAGEWYWGIDRLAYLEERLSDLGARRDKNDNSIIYLQPEVLEQTLSENELPSTKPELHFFLSFRSPYTYLSMPRVRALAEAYGADLKLRFVLPMVMRGLPVPTAKKKYIFLDAAREGRRLGVPYGKIVDPVGKPVERGYSLLPWAISMGRGAEYCWSFMQGVSAKGWDASTNTGMRKIVEDAGLDWQQAKDKLDDQDWRAQAELNQKELLGLNLWGVPSVRVNDVSVWGQDRLWLIEDELKRLTRPTAAS